LTRARDRARPATSRAPQRTAHPLGSWFRLYAPG